MLLRSTGGHAHPPCLGASPVRFCRRHLEAEDNANGVPRQEQDRFSRYQISNLTGELISAPIQGMPAPAHLYCNPVALRTAQGGGPEGLGACYK